MEKAYYPVSVSAVIYNDQRQLLMFSKPVSANWRAISGWVEHEPLNEAISREIIEETRTMRFQIMDVLDAHTYILNMDRIISVWYLFRYLDGEIIPSDDMINHDYRRFTENNLETLSISVPSQFEIIRKAFAMIRQFESNGNQPDCLFRQNVKTKS